MTIDSHTHISRPGAVVNIDPVSLSHRNPEFLDDRWYTIGIHPWNATCCTQRDIDRMRRLARNPRVVAIGECGLDSVHVNYEWVGDGKNMDIVQIHPDVDKQMEILKLHIELSEELRKPLLLHVVKCYPEIIRLRGKLKPKMPWIIHGFRGKTGLAKELMRWGCYLSYGEIYNEQTVKNTPPERMLVETDESLKPIEDIVAAMPVKPGIDLPMLAKNLPETVDSRQGKRSRARVAPQSGELGALDGGVGKDA